MLVLLTEAAVAAPRSSDTDPPLDMLEFLGTWQTRDGRAISPFDLEEESDEKPGTSMTDAPSEHPADRQASSLVTGKRNPSRRGAVDRNPEGQTR